MSFVGWLLLLVVLAAVGAVVARRRRPQLPAPSVSPAEGDADDLARLGLSAARPASARPPAPAPGASAPAALSRDPAAASREQPASEMEARAIAPRPGGVRLGDGAPWNGRAVPLLLGSLSAHARGHVAVIRHDGTVYTVVARTDGGPLTPVRGTPLVLDGPTDLGAGALGGLTALVGGPARATPLGDYVVLVAGRGASADRYLDLLAALTPGADPQRGAEVAETVREAEAPADAPARPVPRAVLIGEEQAAARAEDRPLAFALVTLADAEDRLGRDTPEEVAVAEAALRERLEAAEGVRRVEPFGDLLFGAFVDRDPEGTAAWCDVLAAGKPPLFIGAVAPAHGDAADVRDAAAEALRDAYDKRGARIVAA